MTAPFRGSTSSVTRQQLRSRSYQRVLRDVYVLGNATDELRTRVEAARLLFPDAVPCTLTAALLQKLPVDDDSLLHLARGKRASYSRQEGVRVHRLAIPAWQQHSLDGLPVSDGPRTFADLSAHLDLEALVAVGDVVARRWSDEDLGAAVTAHGKRRGAVLLRQALPLLDRGSDSPAETRARLRLHAAGFTELRHKVVVRDLDGGWLCEPDLADATARVGVQHEGVIHFQKGERQRAMDVDRDELARAEDWQIVTSTSVDDRFPDRLIAKVTAAYLRSAQLLGPHVLPPHLR
jgi:hypothetical protein